MKITKIEVQKRNKDRVSVFVDGEYLFSLHAELVYKFQLKSGQEITDDFIENILKEEEQKKANSYAINLISKTFKTEKQIIDKMKQKGFEDVYINKAVAMLKSYKYINDDLYAKNFISDSINLNKMGKNKIREKLYQKGIDKETISEKLDELVDDEEQFTIALEIAKKKYKSIREEDKRKKVHKLSSFLQYKGFSFTIINKVISEIDRDVEIYEF